ncbi:MAG: ribosome small subunit-dependent GTPase A [Ignavibacteriae bacterium]|nr:ribosome small subunit-dependent GTPase A [Ignavibacteriota bacterium]
MESKDYYVKSEKGELFRCSLRGKFKKNLQHKRNKLLTQDFAVLGDIVKFSEVSNNIGVIEEIEERKNYLSRKAIKARGSLKRGERLEQIVASNIDNLFIVTSINSPKFNNRFLDRVIVSAESSKIDIKIIINKIDLDERNLAYEWEQLYTNIGYKVFIISAIKNKGIEKVKDDLSNKVNLFWGQSGVGKSTILNTMFSHLDLDVGEISNYSNKGTHTTVTGELREVEENTFIIDTPGIREIDPYGIKKEDLSHYFNEFKPFIHNCKFNTCIHEHEPGCSVVEAVENELITVERYESYLNLLNTIEDDMIY